MASQVTDETADYIILTPEWENTARWFAHALADHSFDPFAYGPMASLIEQIRYLTQANPPAVQRIIDELRRKEDARR